jgi:hypothetical protein
MPFLTTIVVPIVGNTSSHFLCYPPHTFATLCHALHACSGLEARVFQSPAAHVPVMTRAALHLSLFAAAEASRQLKVPMPFLTTIVVPIVGNTSSRLLRHPSQTFATLSAT